MIRKLIPFLVLLLAMAFPRLGTAAATLLPNGEQCFQATTGINGMLGTLGTITGGTGGTAGTYAGVALTGGSGSGATANITVAGGAVTAVAVLNPGTQYVTADVLSAVSGTIGNVAGFSVPVNSTAINSSLAGGTVAFYIPATNTFKQTWSNSTQTTLNTNPVILNQNGCAIIYGTGTYRQVVQDSLGNTVWDQLTTDTSANNNTFWAGTAAGTPNVITLIDPGFNATDGSVIDFTALATNTGATTINPSGFGAITVLKDTTAGSVGLTGGEIIAGNPISVLYRASDNAFHILNPVVQSASGASAPLCGATGLVITNNSGTPNTIIGVTADQAVTQTPAGLVLNRSAININALNISTGTVTSTANGMDGEPPGISQWLNIWLIDNGAAVAGLASVSATAPNMPSGYNYRCRMGAMFVDGSGNLVRTRQAGSWAQYVVTATNNTTVPPNIAAGAAGTLSATSPVLAAVSVASVVPPTATHIVIGGTNTYKAGGPAQILLAPNINWGGANNGPSGTNGIVWPMFIDAVSTYRNASQATLILEATTVAWASSGAGGAISALGWKDKVNAN